MSEINKEINKNIYAASLKVDNKSYTIFDINKAASSVGLDINKLPFTLRVLFENVVRAGCSKEVLSSFNDWLKNKKSDSEIPFSPARVLMQDFTGVPAIVDLAAMREALEELESDPLHINPLIPVDLVIDHSVQVDFASSKDAFSKNVAMEVKRNKERYAFLKWGQRAFRNFRVVPPGTGICHQVNLEYLAKVVWTAEKDGATIAYPDTLVGTDSHTTMINGLAVLGWGVGGIEAEAAMLGESLAMILPEVIGVKLTGKLKGSITATDLVLTVTQMLRKKGVVDKFVEFFGEGLSSLSLADRATVANMSPEYGATCGFFPIDQETLKYLKLSARDDHQINLVKKYAEHQNLWRNNDAAPEYSDVIELDLGTLEASLAGPRRPQDRVGLAKAADNFAAELPTLAKGDNDIGKRYPVNSHEFTLGHGDVVIAAITSCTNTSNPSVMVGAGLLAKKAHELGLSSKPWVKTSLAPGSKVVTDYLHASGLDKALSSLGFDLVGYGCTTCIGNSGPLEQNIESCITNNQIVAASVLSGNRNFEGRIHPLVRANYLASPLLVVAYAIAGTINIDLSRDPIGKSKTGKDVYLKDIWPSYEEINEVVNSSLTPESFKQKYSEVFKGDENWHQLHTPDSKTYKWDELSTYIKNPPYFADIKSKAREIKDIEAARILAIFGDSITTDHISPAGDIAKSSPAAAYLMDNNTAAGDFNSYGSRRGNHEVMMRGTFANIRIKNEMCKGVEGGVTINQLNKKQMPIYNAAMEYKANSIPLVVFAGKEYGTGSSRDWAAKGTNLLGIKAVIAESFERIHRSNLVGMGVLPLVFTNGMSRKELNLDGSEEVSIQGLGNGIAPYQMLDCIVKKQDGKEERLKLQLQAFTDNEINYIKNGSILHSVINNIKRESK